MNFKSAGLQTRTQICYWDNIIVLVTNLKLINRVEGRLWKDLINSLFAIIIRVWGHNGLISPPPSWEGASKDGQNRGQAVTLVMKSFSIGYTPSVIVRFPAFQFVEESGAAPANRRPELWQGATAFEFAVLALVNMVREKSQSERYTTCKMLHFIISFVVKITCNDGTKIIFKKIRSKMNGRTYQQKQNF